MNIGLGIGWSTTDIDFWSYASGVIKNVEEDEAKLEAAERLELEKGKLAGEAHVLSEIT